jgi:hypothetical protein
VESIERASHLVPKRRPNPSARAHDFTHLDRFGARPASVVGLALFGVASCIIATAGTQAALLAGRALQSLAAAVAVPSTLAAVPTKS